MSTSYPAVLPLDPKTLFHAWKRCHWLQIWWQMRVIAAAVHGHEWWNCAKKEGDGGGRPNP